MTLFRYILTIIISTAFCWVAFLLVIFRIDPIEAGALGFIFFYFSLALSLVGTLSLIGLLVRRILYPDELMFRQVAISFRQAVFFAILIIGALFLQSQRLLTWWNIIILIAALSILEFLFISFKKRI